MRPSLCFWIRTWNSIGGDRIHDGPIELQMGIQKKSCWISSRPRCAHVYVFRFELRIPQMVIGSKVTLLNYRWEFKKFMLDQLKAQMRPSLCFQIRTWNSIGGDRIQDDPIELQMGIQKKIMLDSLKALMRPSLCFQIRTQNSMGGDRIRDDPIELQMGILKNHAALVQGPESPKCMFLDSSLEFHGW